MKRDIYTAIIAFIDGAEFDFELTFTRLRSNFPEERVESLRSILTQKYSREVTKNYQSLATKSKRKELYKTFEKSFRGSHASQGNNDSGCAIVDIAKRNRFSSAVTAKIILSEHLNCSDAESQQHVKSLLKDTNLISNGKLAFEVWRACLEDENAGYYSDCIKSAVGQEYERRLKRKLRCLGISYQVSIHGPQGGRGSYFFLSSIGFLGERKSVDSDISYL